MTSNESRSLIQEHRKQIDLLRSSIDAIAKETFPDFHFLDYRVSTFWECDDSPAGMCIFELNDHGAMTKCHFCGGPPERK